MTPADLDRTTVDLIFALRDSLTDVSRLDFWEGRCVTALQTAAAGASTGGEAVSIAARKLQIDGFGVEPSRVVARVAAAIDTDYAAWAEHVAATGIYLVALARVENTTKKAAKAATEEPMF